MFDQTHSTTFSGYSMFDVEATVVQGVHNFRTWTDVGSEVYTIFVNGLTLVQMCTLFPQND